jgi:hypothetical protein
MKTLSCGLLLFVMVSGLASATENVATNTPAPDTQGAAAETRSICQPGQNAGADACTPSAPPYTEKLRADADAVLKGPDFHQMKSATVAVPRPWLEKWLQRERKKEEKKTTNMPNFSGLAQILKILLLVLLAGLLCWLLWRGYQWLAPQLIQNRKRQNHGPVREARSLPLHDPAQLPERISNSAARAWQAGHATEALSLLYRGARATLAIHHQLSLPGGATEGDYQRLLQRCGTREVAQGFNLIVQAWMAQAYADQRPDDFPRLLHTYRQHFEHSGSAP